MAMIIELLGSLAATLGTYGLYRLFKVFYEEYISPLRDLPGPKSTSLIYGNIKEIWEAENSAPHEKWVLEYGSTIQYNGLFGMRCLYTTDTKALNHILMDNNNYQKLKADQYNIRRIFGVGVPVVEGDKHRKQRRVMNPAFGPAQIRELTGIFMEKAIQLRDIWASQSANAETGAARIDVLSWLSRMTLDVIGLAGFNYKFDALSGDLKQNELHSAFSTMFKSDTKMTIVPILRAQFPLLRFLRTDRDSGIQKAQQTMSCIGSQLLRDSKRANENIAETNSWKARDLLSLLIRANMATDLPEHQRMSDEEVLSQVPAFIVAGHETTSTGTTWALYALTQDLRVQTKLREELLTVDTDTPTMDELNALTYLDMVVRETMRIYPPVPSAMRVSMKDDILPLHTPFKDRKGVLHDGIRIRKGQKLTIPILAVNRDKSIWGPDSMEFIPERWESVPEAAGTIPGIWGNMLTFLSGPRACIGYRFSLVEMKALLFTLVRAFEFELAVPVKDIVKKQSVVLRPILLTDPKGGNQLPLLIKPYQRP